MKRISTYMMLGAMVTMIAPCSHALSLGDMLQKENTPGLLTVQGKGWEFILKEVRLTKKLYLPHTDDWDRISTYERKAEDSVILFVRYNMQYSAPFICQDWVDSYKFDSKVDKENMPAYTIEKPEPWFTFRAADGSSIGVYQTRSTNAEKDIVAIAEVPASKLLGATIHWQINYFNIGEVCTYRGNCHAHKKHVSIGNSKYELQPEPTQSFQASLNITAQTQIEDYVRKEWVVGEKTPEAIKMEREERALDNKMRMLEMELQGLMNSL